MQKFFQGGGKFGVRTKWRGGSLCGMLHPTLARGGGGGGGARMTQGGVQMPLLPLRSVNVVIPL